MIKTDLNEDLERIDSELRQMASDDYSLGFLRGQFVAFVYQQGIRPAHFSELVIDLTYEGDPNKESLKYWLKAIEAAKKVREMSKNKEHLGFRASVANFPSIRGAQIGWQRIRAPSFFYIGAGASMDHPYPDDAFYQVDNLGVGILEAGIRAGKTPDWFITNYNFCYLEGIGATGNLNYEGKRWVKDSPLVILINQIEERVGQEQGKKAATASA